MSKSVTIGKRPASRPSAEAVDKWMEGQGGGESSPPPAKTAATPAAKMKRLTIDVPDSLHRRVKSRCGMDGLRMADVIRELLEQRFPVV